MNDNSLIVDENYIKAMSAIQKTIERFHGCNEAEKETLRRDLKQLHQMHSKLAAGRVEIAVFGEISTGKSALINALIGNHVAEVDVQGGWTKEVWRVEWEGNGYCIPGLHDSQVVLVDTPGLNEVGGGLRAKMAQEATQQADIILFVTDSDLNDTEYAALKSLTDYDKPILVVLNKIDLFSQEQSNRLIEIILLRLGEITVLDNLLCTAADPREIEYIIESSDGTIQKKWKKPEPDITDLKVRILEVLDKEGLALVTLNAALYASDKADRLISIKVQIRQDQAQKTVWKYAVVKAAAVGVNQIPIADTVGGGAVDVMMVLTLGRIYGLEMTWKHAREIVTSIAKAAGWMAATEIATHAVCWTCKAFTFGAATFYTALPQGAAAGYGSYVVGQAAKYYFEQGASWGDKSPKAVVTSILDQTDKQSILNQLQQEIRDKIFRNRYSEKA